MAIETFQPWRSRHARGSDAVHGTLAHRRCREDRQGRSAVEPRSGAVFGIEGTRQDGTNGAPGTNAVEFRTELRW